MLTDIALLAGVSPSTVSRALSGAKPVAAATQARVVKAVRELDYRWRAPSQAFEDAVQWFREQGYLR